MTTPERDPSRLGEMAPCPFCGANGEAHMDSDRDWYVFCTGCDMETARVASEADAIAAWNRRAPDPALLERIASLEGALRAELAEVECDIRWADTGELSRLIDRRNRIEKSLAPSEDRL